LQSKARASQNAGYQGVGLMGNYQEDSEMTLLELVRNNEISSTDDLKAEFHRRSFECHPDRNSSNSSHDDFLALQSDYEESRLLLTEASLRKDNMTTDSAGSQSVFVELFLDLISLGLLDDRFRNRSNRSFLTRLKKSTSVFDSRANGTSGDFTRCLVEIGRLEKQSELPRIRALFHAMISYRYNQMKYMKQQMIIEISNIREFLQDRDMIMLNCVVEIIESEILGDVHSPTSRST